MDAQDKVHVQLDLQIFVTAVVLFCNCKVPQFKRAKGNIFVFTYHHKVNIHILQSVIAEEKHDTICVQICFL